jgi:hypothetical protein
VGVITFDCQTSSLRFFLTNVSVQLRHLIAPPFFSFFIKLFLGKKGLKENADLDRTE